MTRQAAWLLLNFYMVCRVNRGLATPAFLVQQVGKNLLGFWDAHMQNLMLIKNTSLFFCFGAFGRCLGTLQLQSWCVPERTRGYHRGILV